MRDFGSRVVASAAGSGDEVPRALLAASGFRLHVGLVERACGLYGQQGRRSSFCASESRIPRARRLPSAFRLAIRVRRIFGGVHRTGVPLCGEGFWRKERIPSRPEIPGRRQSWTPVGGARVCAQVFRAASPVSGFDTGPPWGLARVTRGLFPGTDSRWIRARVFRDPTWRRVWRLQSVPKGEAISVGGGSGRKWCGWPLEKRSFAPRPKTNRAVCCQTARVSGRVKTPAVIQLRAR